MWTFAALIIFGFVGPIVVRKYENYLYRNEAPWLSQEMGTSRDNTSNGTSRWN